MSNPSRPWSSPNSSAPGLIPVPTATSNGTSPAICSCAGLSACLSSVPLLTMPPSTASMPSSPSITPTPSSVTSCTSSTKSTPKTPLLLLRLSTPLPWPLRLLPPPPRPLTAPSQRSSRLRLAASTHLLPLQAALPPARPWPTRRATALLHSAAQHQALLEQAVTLAPWLVADAHAAPAGASTSQLARRAHAAARCPDQSARRRDHHRCQLGECSELPRTDKGSVPAHECGRS